MADLMLVSCVSCSGIYPRAQKDGTEYYHVCPARRVVTGAVVDAQSGKVTAPAVYAAIDQPRNENVAGLDAQRKAIIVAPGKGTLAVVDPAIIAAFTAPPEVL